MSGDDESVDRKTVGIDREEWERLGIERDEYERLTLVERYDKKLEMGIPLTAGFGWENPDATQHERISDLEETIAALFGTKTERESEGDQN